MSFNRVLLPSFFYHLNNLVCESETVNYRNGQVSVTHRVRKRIVYILPGCKQYNVYITDMLCILRRIKS